MEEIGRVLGKRYRLVSLIGRGRFTNVFLAHDLSQSRWAVVKLLPAEVLPQGWATDPSLAGRFSEAARETASVNHPHIVAIRDWGNSGYGLHMVTDYVEGGSLLGMLESGHLLSLSQTLMVGLEVARALEHIHRLGLIHRDIRPSNILFDSQGRAHLADLGMSRMIASLETAGKLVSRSVFAAADEVRYASPELAQGLTPDLKSDVYSLEATPNPSASLSLLTPDHKSDVYSLVLVLAEALSGRVPFDSEDPEYSQMAKMGRQLDLGNQFGRLGRVLEQAGQPDRNERPSARDLATELLTVAESLHRPEPLPLSITQPELPEPGMPEPGMPGFDHAGSEAPAIPRDVIPRDVTGTPPAVVLPQDVTPDVAPHRTDPAGLRRLFVLMVLLVGALGFGGYMTWDNWFSPETRPVPDLSGVGEAGLLRLEDEFGWVLDRREQRRDGTETGQVLSQSPQPGTGLKRGETVTVWVSLGPKLVTIPGELAGMAVQDAETLLAGVGLSLGRVVERHDETVLEGIIIEVDELFPEVEPGGQVDLVVSLGPVPRVVPAIDAGTPRAVVTERLEELRLRVEEWRVENNQVASGLVVRVEPPPGTEVAADSVVTVVVSDGPQQVTVPTLATLSVEEAAEILEGLGLCRGEIEGPNDTEILASNPPVAAVVDFGTCIQLITRPQ